MAVIRAVRRPVPYDVTADGSRVLALVTSERRAGRPLTLVQNGLPALESR